MTRRLAFGRFALDLERGNLRSGDREIALRSEAAALLRVLATNPDRTISAEELLEAGWPGLIVADDRLAKTIGELRTALADDTARLIETVPQHGYRFVPAAAPEERRKARGWHPLRWRWIYGILAPLLLAMTVVVLLLWNRDGAVPASQHRPATTIPKK